MPLRDAPTPTPEELDQLAEVGPADMERAAAFFDKAVKNGPRRNLAGLLDATPETPDPASGPLPDA